MKVTQTEPRDQRKSFAKYKQTLGHADPIIVRRGLTFPHAVTHPTSRATARQRDRLSRASQYEASIHFEDKNLIPFESRLSFTSKPSGKGTAKILTGRQAIVSQAIRTQQLGYPIINHLYPCLETSDAAGNVFDCDTAYLLADGDTQNKIYGRKLNEYEFIFPQIPPFAKSFEVVTTPRKGFVWRTPYGNIPRANISHGSCKLRPTIIIQLIGYFTFVFSRSRYSSTLYEPLQSGFGIIGHMLDFYGHIGQPQSHWRASFNFQIQYLSTTQWRYTALPSYFPPEFDIMYKYQTFIFYDNKVRSKSFSTFQEMMSWTTVFTVKESQGEK